MTEQQFQIDPDHPWVQASAMMEPQPIPAQISLEGIQIEEDGNEYDAVMLSIIDPTGVKNVIFPYQMLNAIVNRGAQMLQEFAQKAQQGILVANKADMAEVIKLHNQTEGLKKR